METATTNKTLDYNVKQTTISSNNKIIASTDTGSNHSRSSTNSTSTEIETLDLSSETESKGFFETIGNGIKEAGENLAESASNLADNVKNIATDAKDWLANTGKKVAATGAVVTTSVVSGLGKLVEKAADGLEWVGGKVVEGGAWVSEKVASAFSDETAEDIKKWREDFSKDVKEDIARDKIGELNKQFYEHTGVGKWINEHSALKYDSEVAQKIQGATEIAAEIAAATAITIATGGTAAAFIAPFLVGTAVGAGGAAEATYQEHGTDTTILQELGVAGSGALTGLTWVANGKLGQGALEIGKDVIAKGGATVLKDMGAQMFNKEFVFSKLKEGLSIKNAGKLNINAIMNYGQAAMGTAGSLTPYITGEEKIDGTAIAKIGGTYLTYLGLNVLEDSARDYVSGYKSTEAVTKILTEAEKAKLEAIPAPVSASAAGSGIESDPLKSGFRIPTDEDLDSLPLVSKDKIEYVKPIRHIPDDKKLPDGLYQSGEFAPLATADEISSRLDKIGETSIPEKNAYQKQLEAIAKKLGITPEETQKVLDEKLRELVEESEFVRRTGVSTLEKCLDSGDIRNQFQTNVSSGYNSPNLRAGLELDAMHVPYDSAYADRPVYGMLFPSDPKAQNSYFKNGPGLGYGTGMSRCAIIFNKDAVIDSTSICVGDSLDYSPIYSGGWASPTKASDPKFTGGYFGFADSFSSVEELKAAKLEQLTGTYDDYIEVQIHGAANHQMTSEIIKEVLFERRPSPTIIKKLENAGIGWRVAKRRLLPW